MLDDMEFSFQSALIHWRCSDELELELVARKSVLFLFFDCWNGRVVERILMGVFFGVGSW